MSFNINSPRCNRPVIDLSGTVDSRCRITVHRVMKVDCFSASM